jgi:hypothetical protein
LSRPAWDFDYRPVPGAPRDNGGPRRDLVVATEHDVDPAHVVELLQSLSSDIEAAPLVISHPVYWTRLRSSTAVDRNEITARLERGGIRVRYVVCSRHGTHSLAGSLQLENARPRRARDWKARSAQREEQREPRAWSIGRRGVNADRQFCGSGAGTRLAVIDDDSADAENLDLDAQISICQAAPVRANHHAALVVGFSVGTRQRCGVAPSASPRLYVIPKPGQDVVSLPVAIVHAVDDGADVVVCATYIDDVAGPLLDDALELAAQLGRGGRGTPVFFPTSREISSPPGSMHASLSLSVGAPASHPLAFCIGPSGADGSWFLWRERSGRLRPFANRGPAVRWLAPGDDMPDPLSAGARRVAHSESSGAVAMASGVALLVLAQNPELTCSELDQLLTATAVAASERVAEAPLADPSDVLPCGRDGDGHDAKHGYGRLAARSACLGASDPIAAALIRMGSERAAACFAELRATDPSIARAYTEQLARWGARALLADSSLLHAVAALLRHVRLLCHDPARSGAQPEGALLHQTALVVRMARGSARAPRPSDVVSAELLRLLRALCELSAEPDGALAWESAVYLKFSRVWATPAGSSEVTAAE